METIPDFYVYGGDNYPFDVAIACWKLSVLQSEHGKDILLLKIDPPAPHGILATNAKRNVIGLASRSTLSEAGEFGEGSYTGGVMWQIAENENANYVPLRSVGLVMLWKDRQTLIRFNPTAQ